MSTTDLRSDSNADSTRDAVNLRVGGLQVHGIGSRRLVYKEVVELLPNCKKFYFWWLGNPSCGDPAGSNHIEKENGKNGEYDFSAVGIGAILGNKSAV